MLEARFARVERSTHAGPLTAVARIDKGGFSRADNTCHVLNRPRTSLGAGGKLPVRREDVERIDRSRNAPHLHEEGIREAFSLRGGGSGRSVERICIRIGKTLGISTGKRTQTFHALCGKKQRIELRGSPGIKRSDVLFGGTGVLKQHVCVRAAEAE